MKIVLEKYCALGNDYLILDPKKCFEKETGIEQNNINLRDEKFISKLCDRNWGLGADGVLYGPINSSVANFKLNIFNSDGSEAEKSGNGLTIFTQYLRDNKYTEDSNESDKNESISIETLGGIIHSKINQNKLIELEMGKISLLRRGHLKPSIQVLINDFFGQILNSQYYFLSIGNPHCVIPVPRVFPELAKLIGPLIENDESFPQKTNVQFLEITEDFVGKIEIWERGSGYTLGSGSSSCAAAYVLRLLTHTNESVVNIFMRGGILKIEFENSFVKIWNSAKKIATCSIDYEFSIL